ncbi:UDP-glucose 4-epimerase isoform X3 [Zootermopsis nevadensis]|uniref:UDP-glucose 4-epimerase n=3 Tax=Zootermopsis nevadensis TaxID=136037 RepID=A0A067RNT6_ZOONE|nr:UDP-glucose 4-epimerase isoform X3 [Zootermopsis nevadensis]XP_021914126.1 UDP-glucose 4-epimerase isoform X3 [Zootermopsis nevadensis]KDR22270.1 putative UDP-glucose 4-epimerase [Zootermopsis nevadensis]
MSGATVLVTGGAGYVGSHSVVQLLNQGFKVVVVDNLVNASPECLKRVEEITGKKVISVLVDLCNKDEVDKVFSKYKIDCVIHFAALKAVGESVSMPLTYYRNNVGGSVTLLEVMKAHNVKKIVYSSSATVYGTPQELPLTEDHPTGLGCTNPYGKSKYFVEEMLKDLVKSDETWSVISLRYFNPVGAHESGKIGEDPKGVPNNIMPYIAQVAVGRRKDLRVFGNDYNTLDGTGVRDYVHIQDLAVGHIAATNKILNPNFCGWKVYNLGTGSGLSVLQLVKAFEEASGQKIPCEVVGRRAGDIDASYADVSLAKKELHWEATRGVLDMCRDTWRWQSLNPNGYGESE